MSKIKIDYSARPNKSLVRYRLYNVVDEVFKPHQDRPVNLSYITFSGYRFVDSIEFYKRFNIKKIYSLEYKEDIFRRACFNRPYKFIDIILGRVQDFLAQRYQNISQTNKVIFLDYEWAFRDDILVDLESLFSIGFFDNDSLLFITFNRAFKKDGLSSTIKKIIPDDIMTKEAYENWLEDNFSHFIFSKLQKKYKNRKSLIEKLKIFYRDTTDMAFFGFYIRDRKNSDPLVSMTELEMFALPPLTFLEKNYIRNHFEEDISDIAFKLGLTNEDIQNFINHI